MKINTNFFGEIEIDEKEIITFEKGMIGFEDIKNFALVGEEGLFVEWLQSIEETTSFAVMDPFIADTSYSFDMPDKVLEELNIKDPSEILIRTVVVIPEDITKIRTNLQAPVIINTKEKKAMQILLDDTYPMRYEFYEKVGV